MTAINFIKENRVLVAGLVLPLLLVAVFAIAKMLPASMVPPPTHKIVFYSAGWSNKGQINFKVDDVTHYPVANFAQNPNYKAGTNDPDPTSIIYIYDPATNKVEQKTVALDKDGKPTAFDNFSKLKLSIEPVSPDGYVFESYHYRNSSLITDVFSYRSRDHGPALSKDGHLITIPFANPNYSSIQFLGWVIEGDK